MTRSEAIKRLDSLLGRHLLNCVPRPRPSNAVDVSRILFIRPGGIGDAVYLAPAIRATRATFPEAGIDVLAERRNAGVFALVPQVGRVLRYDRLRDWPHLLRNRYDAVIDTEQWHRLSAVVARLMRPAVSIGYATNERKGLFTYSVSYSHDDYEADSFLRLLDPLGIGVSATTSGPFLNVPDIARKRAGELLYDILHQPFVVLFPGASIPERRWGAEKFRAVAEALAGEGVPSVIVGGQENVADAAKIATGTLALNLAGRTSLAETAAVIDKSAVLVSGDSGILHIGVGLGKPTVSLFGPGIAKKWAPQGDNHTVLNKNLPCSPCTRFGYTPKCPEEARCLREITVEEAAGAVLKLLLPPGVDAAS